MKKRILVIVISVMVLLVAGTLLYSNFRTFTTEDAERVYIEYLETATVDRRSAVERFCHFENLTDKELCASSGYNLWTYEVLQCTQLSDTLWSASCKLTNEVFPNGVWGVHYIGVIDGRLYVMLNDKDIPPTLKEGLEIEHVAPSADNIVGEADILDPIS